MISDTERREVAERLKGYVSEWRDMPSFSVQKGVACSLGIVRFDVESQLLRLADLIEPEPERTCHDTDYSRESITCSECGEITMNTLYFVDLDGGYRTVKSHRPRFCSNCGARVIGEEAGDAD